MLLIKELKQTGTFISIYKQVQFTFDNSNKSRGGLGERCKLPQRGLGQSRSWNRIWCILALKDSTWWQQIWRLRSISGHSDQMSKISGQLLISGQFQDFCDISGISGQLGALCFMVRHIQKHLLERTTETALEDATKVTIKENMWKNV